MEITDAMKETLASYIAEELRADFETYYLTGNLRDTIRVTKGEGDSVNVEIPAEAYDLARLRSEGVIVKRPDLGSYAELVNVTGGLSHKHVGYVEKALDVAIRRWLNYYKIKAEVKENG